MRVDTETEMLLAVDAHELAGVAVAYYLQGLGVEFINTIRGVPFCDPRLPPKAPTPPEPPLDTRTAAEALQRLERGELTWGEFETIHEARMNACDAYIHALTRVLATPERLSRVAIGHLAGAIAVARFAGEAGEMETADSRSAARLEAAAALVREHMGRSAEEVPAVLGPLHLEASRLVADHWPTIIALAERLCEVRQMEGDAVHELIASVSGSRFAL